jgi:hypothetical protein
MGPLNRPDRHPSQKIGCPTYVIRELGAVGKAWSLHTMFPHNTLRLHNLC